MKIVSYIILVISGFFVGLSVYLFFQENKKKLEREEILKNARMQKAKIKKEREQIDSLEDSIKDLEIFENSIVQNGNEKKEKIND